MLGMMLTSKDHVSHTVAAIEVAIAIAIARVSGTPTLLSLLV